MEVIAASSGLLRAVEVLRQGGIVIHPTETCYGIACDLSNADAVARVFAVKQRPETQPISGLFTNIAMAEEYTEWPDGALALAQKHLPGPLTLVLPLRTDAPHVLHPIPHAASATIGVRISSHPIAEALVSLFGSPLSTTSANLHGQPNPYSAEQILKQFEQVPMEGILLLDGGALPEAPPSTVMLQRNGTWDIVRPGKIG